MWNPFKEKAVVEFDYKPQLSTLNETGLINLVEQFKGEVEQKKVKFPAELGEEHPFDFKTMEDLYRKFGFYTAVIDKYVDFVWGGGYYVKCDDERALKIIEDFMQDVGFDTIGRKWTKDGLMKGNGIIEIGPIKETKKETEGKKLLKSVAGLKTLNSNYIYVERDKKGKIEGYNQYKGAFDRFAKEKVIHFTPDQIAHFSFNVVGDDAYGIGIGYPAMQLVDNLLKMSRDQHWLMERKANSPLQAKLGKVDGNVKIIPKATDIEAYGKKMEIMSKKTNWATDDLVELKVVDFGKIGDKFNSILEHDLNMLIYAFQTPGVLLGMSNINMGIAKVEMEAYQRRIQSIQAEVEKIIEEKIFKRVLNANGFDVHVEFEWGTPSVMEVEARMKLIVEMMKSPTITGAMNMMLEDEMANLLKFDTDEWEKLKLEQEAKEEEERKRLEAQPQPIVPGQNAKFPQKVAPKAQQPKQPVAQPVKQMFKPEEFFKSFLDMMLKQEEKKAKKELELEEQRIRQMKDNDDRNFKFMEAQKIPEKTIDIEVKKDLDEIKQKLEKKTPKQKLLRKKTGLLPAFRITRKTELAKIGEPMVVKMIREKKNINYEYEKECKHCDESWDNVNDIQEWLGFNYKKYLGEIAAVLSVYGFEQIKAVNEIELEAGMFTEVQVNELRKVLDNGFKKGQGLKEMANQVDKKVKPKDLYRMTGEGNIKVGASGLPILSKSAEKRAIAIVRTEVTRVANKGAVEFYKKNDIKQIKWVASFGDRTCPECEGLNGQIFEINSTPEIPLHPLCRCTLSPVVELK